LVKPSATRLVVGDGSVSGLWRLRRAARKVPQPVARDGPRRSGGVDRLSHARVPRSGHVGARGASGPRRPARGGDRGASARPRPKRAERLAQKLRSAGRL
jgi:hypothetical protein